jgi:hypothetical protein
LAAPCAQTEVKMKSRDSTAVVWMSLRMGIISWRLK